MAPEKKKFAEKEGGILIDLVTGHGNVLESKCAYAVSLSEKKNKWKQIGEFNSKNGVDPLAERQLRWNNLIEKWRRCKATDIPSDPSFLKKR